MILANLWTDEWVEMNFTINRVSIQLALLKVCRSQTNAKPVLFTIVGHIKHNINKLKLLQQIIFLWCKILLIAFYC